MTLGTDMKFTLSFPCAKSLCWWKWTLSYFKTQKLWSKDNWIQMGRAYIVMWTVLCFQFYTHWSLQNSRASHYFQTVAELCISVYNLCPSKPCPFAQIQIDMSVHVQIFAAQMYTFGNWDFNQAFSFFLFSFFLFSFSFWRQAAFSCKSSVFLVSQYVTAVTTTLQLCEWQGALHMDSHRLMCAGK